METIYPFMLASHIAAGFIALLSGPVAMLAPKGQRVHVLAGRIYYYAMLWVIATAISISVYKQLLFLLLVAVFSFYSIWMGRRALALKNLHLGQRPRWYDWAVAVVALGFNTTFAVVGVLTLLRGNAFGWVALGFGLGGVLMVVRSVMRFIKKPRLAHHWLLAHIGGMVGGYTATVTAFLVNNSPVPGMANWIVPPLAGGIIISLLLRRYARRMATE